MMKSCNCRNRKEMLENSLFMYEDALTELEDKFLKTSKGELLVSQNARYKWDEMVTLKDFYEKEIFKLRNELKV